MTPNQLQSQLTFADKLGVMPIFRSAAAATGVPLPILLAVASRESHIGAMIYLSKWKGDHGWAHGIMQIDIRYHPDFTNNHQPDDHRANILYGANYLAKHYGRFGNWQHAAAAYNAGAGNVSSALASGQDPDSRTTGGNYGRDVMQRAAIIRDLLPFDLSNTLILTIALTGIFATYYLHPQKNNYIT